MVSFTFFLGFAGAIVSVLGSSGSPQLSRRVLHEHRRSPPIGWTLHKRADPDATLPLSIALVQPNLHNLESYLLDIADPDSPNYGKHWTPAQIAETFRPSKESVDVVHSWLMSDGVDPARIELSDNGQYVRVNVSVSEAERLLATEYYVYQEDASSTNHLACGSGYHLPEHVSRHVDVVTPTIHLGRLTASVISSSQGSTRVHARDVRRTSQRMQPPPLSAKPQDSSGGCSTFVTLDCIRELYSFDYTVGGKGNIGVVELGSENYNGKDMDTFFKSYVPDLVGQRPKMISIDGGAENMGQTNGNLIGESNMDFMLVMGLLDNKVPVYQYQIGNNGWFDELLAAFDKQYCSDAGLTGDSSCGGTMITNVISVSYGSGEDEPSKFLVRTCNEIGKLSLGGTTFVVSSGDNGPTAIGGQCMGSDGTPVDGNGNFLPGWPVTCPYITAVGATQMQPGKSTSDPESASIYFGSGGGFSNVFPRPSWQDRMVSSYLSRSAPNYGANVYNRSGRGYPDVSANGAYTVIVSDGSISESGGTSAAAPIFASMIVAVNDARIAAGKSPVGWINPALYSSTFANVFNDITIGSAPGCGTNGFSAVPGWDPVTGLGTVNFKLLLSRFMALP
ncbi:subtilisin-like protein [Trametes coccinea BRFM310]|uniref:Subtilisin-like protein n=1 Tax=Trametes coccinea (strain BRFM310) TaxID=1353009 RepID=A0A1Y2J3Q3_TRAC3|nr:subtilisin-like protein [Trametes coccinea BRFM310]